MKEPPPIEIEEAEVERLIEQAQRGLLDGADQKRIVPLLRTLLWLERTLLETRIGLAKLRKILFGKRTEKPRRKPQQPPEGGAGSSGDSDGKSDPPSDARLPAVDTATAGDGRPSHPDTGATTGSGEQADVGTDDRKSTPRPGHGRLGAADYPGAEQVFCTHDQYRAGDRCPECTRGRLYPSRPLVRLRFVGQALAKVTHYVPWEQVEQVADTGWVMYEQLKMLGANQPLVYQDDTGARILSQIRENQAEPPPERKGMYTTVLRFEGDQPICLYFTGRRHAGENLDAILARRDPDLPPIQWMSDGLAANTPKEHKDQALDLSCLVHGRRQFVDIDDFFPDQCARVIDAIAEIYKHEAHCQDQQLTPAQRLAYHQANSREVMDSLKTWMEQQLEDKLVEPNSRLGGAFDYLLKRWKALTRFLHIPGAPLDNNAAERALKMILRYRKNSLFYKNEHGAYVGDVLTSLIETCRLNGVNPLDYLNALMHNRSAVFADPAAWLPWNYRDTLPSADKQLPLSHLPPIIGHPGVLGVAVPQ